MNTEYIQLRLRVQDDLHEFLIAELSDLDFEGFEQLDNEMIATIPKNRFDDFKREQVEHWLFKFGGRDACIEKEEVVRPQNWNRTWEESIKAQVIGQFYVYPSWSTGVPVQGKIPLMIDPKMAFGTGYHETTRLMLEQIPETVQKGDRVLDAGTGTGILGIAALKIGAASVFGFDIDEWSKTNAAENILLNQVEDFDVELGSVERVPVDQKFNLILANINRNALKEILPDLISFLEVKGKILLSGLLEDDESAISNLECMQNLEKEKTFQKGEWIAMLFSKS